ncbi:BZ3500_MvSof-1268-A1-R1_Chr5-3g08300 [Microbotryum saponariae]|uniref:BZ3500_MvSof-1268-A1-R1_Chr5-3g08300 protein n=1 Tax=Microbotryum saponariae TaxID=289078 RepID=A0A2X0LS97_9BASI|nr:BZ3500_MvSof-1268-A1-R1_Chr5-3g08300 [Microbotryum saponariae]SDA08408.1 BZ3501_MvSof-1269-A2-R1_Chr5-3g08028 [Microbotryum saponariae]
MTTSGSTTTPHATPPRSSPNNSDPTSTSSKMKPTTTSASSASTSSSSAPPGAGVAVGTQATGSGGGRRDEIKPLPQGAACTACRKKKLVCVCTLLGMGLNVSSPMHFVLQQRCDGSRPKCQTCVRLGHDCVYGDPVHEKLQERTRELEAKVQSLEEELSRYRLSHGPTPDPISSSGNSLYSKPASAQIFSHGSSPASFDEPENKPFVFRPGAGVAGPNAAVGLNGSHLQSFPYSVTHPQSPQLANLRNSPLDAAQNATLLPAHPLAASASSAHPNSALGEATLGLYPPEPAPPSTTPLLGLETANLEGEYYNESDWTAHGHQTQTPGQSQTQGMGLQRVWGARLPDVELMLDLTDIYFSTTHIHLPFLYRPRFLYSLQNPHSLASPPSLSLIFAVLAIAAPYHDHEAVRTQSRSFYLLAREKIETSIAIGVQPTGKTIASLTVETVQALCICTMIEMGCSDHQRAFLSIGQAVRISAMLGLHRMDEDRLAGLTGQTSSRRLRPPALHQLPDDPLMLEECRRTMATVLCVDRLESACVGWPTALAEHDVRLLLPCDELLFESGRCQEGDNPIWWPENGQNSDVGPRLGTFAWFSRVVWIGARIQSNAYGSVGQPAGGPYHTRAAGLDDLRALQEMDHVLESFRHKLHWLANEPSQKSKGFNAALIQILIVLNCNFINAHHLLVAQGHANPSYPSQLAGTLGTAEYSMQRCIEGMGALYEILSQAAMYENLRTTLERSRITTFSSFLPYTSYAIAFPAKFAIGDWSTLGESAVVICIGFGTLLMRGCLSAVAARNRTENVPGRVSTGPTGPVLPQSDVLFGVGFDDKRLAFVDCFCDALDRMGLVWAISSKFSSMVRGDRARLAVRVFERASQSPHSQGSTVGATPGATGTGTTAY